MIIATTITTLIALVLYLLLRAVRRQCAEQRAQLRAKEHEAEKLRRDLQRIENENVIDAECRSRVEPNYDQLSDAIRELESDLPASAPTTALLRRHTLAHGWYSLDAWNARRALEEHWSKGIRIFDFVYTLKYRTRYQPKAVQPDSKPPPPRWRFGFTASFTKSIAAIDRKLQGRVLQAITDLAEHPDTPHGDTIAPLSGNLKGLWRYRLGDYRLLYQPLTNTHEILLLDFSSRGDAYA